VDVSPIEVACDMLPDSSSPLVGRKSCRSGAKSEDGNSYDDYAHHADSQ
jgi:hypothetical protein